jgi:uncharacterized protein YxeA
MKKIIIIFLAVLMAGTINAQSSSHKFIQPIFGQDKLVIELTSGKKKLTDDTSITTDQNFKNYNLDQLSCLYYASGNVYFKQRS